MHAAVNDVERKSEPEAVGSVAGAGRTQVLAHLVRHDRTQIRDAVVDVDGDVAFRVIFVARPADDGTAIGSIVKSLEKVCIIRGIAAALIGGRPARTGRSENKYDRHEEPRDGAATHRLRRVQGWRCHCRVQ